jgi:hypothetical protein
MTSHDFDVWNDANGPAPAAREPQPIDAAVNTLRDIYNLTTEDLPDATVVARVQTMARAALERLGVPAVDDGLAGSEEEEETAFIHEPATGWFEDGPDTAA